MTNSSIKFNPALKDVDGAPMVVVTASVFTALISLSTGTRITVKIFKDVRLQIEDLFIILGLAFNITCNAVEFQAIRHGFGRHLQFLTSEQERTVKMWNQMGILFATLPIWAVKMSICFFILSLIRGAHHRSAKIVWVLIAFISTAHGAQSIFWGLQARPLKKLWDPETPGTVSNKKLLVNSIIAFTVISSITDLFYELSPIYFFGGLQMSKKRKLTILGMTGSGLLVFAISIIRLSFVKGFFRPDVSWELRKVYMCTIIERCLAQVVADRPALYPIIRSANQKVRTIITQLSRGGTMPGGTGRD